MDKTVRQTIEFESALTTILKVIGSVWDDATPEQRKAMRQIENVIDDVIEPIDDSEFAIR